MPYRRREKPPRPNGPDIRRSKSGPLRGPSLVIGLAPDDKNDLAPAGENEGESQRPGGSCR